MLSDRPLGHHTRTKPISVDVGALLQKGKEHMGAKKTEVVNVNSF